MQLVNSMQLRVGLCHYLELCPRGRSEDHKTSPCVFSWAGSSLTGTSMDRIKVLSFMQDASFSFSVRFSLHFQDETQASYTPGKRSTTKLVPSLCSLFLLPPSRHSEGQGWQQCWRQRQEGSSALNEAPAGWQVPLLGLLCLSPIQSWILKWYK